MSRESDQTSDTGPLLSGRAWIELRESTPDPAICDASDAALVAAAILADVRSVRDAHGDVISDTPAGSAGRRLANELNSIERLALAAQRLGVEALTARLRYDHDHMATTCADMYWHLSEAAELCNGLEDLRDSAMAEAENGRLSVVDVDIDVIDLESPPGDGATIDLRTGSVEPPAPPPNPTPTSTSTSSSAAPRRIVAAAMGDTTDPAVTPPAATVASAELSLVPVEAEPRPAWEPPQPTFVPVPAARPALAGSWRARRRELRRERALIVDDERNRGRGLRPLLPTWLSQGAATLIVVFLIALIAIGIWMMVVSDAGPF